MFLSASNTDRVGASTHSLGSLLQCVTTLWLRQCMLGQKEIRLYNFSSAYWDLLQAWVLPYQFTV